MAEQKYIGENIVPTLKTKWSELDTRITANTELIGDVDTLLTTLDTGTGV